MKRDNQKYWKTIAEELDGKHHDRLFLYQAFKDAIVATCPRFGLSRGANDKSKKDPSKIIGRGQLILSLHLHFFEATIQIGNNDKPADLADPEAWPIYIDHHPVTYKQYIEALQHFLEQEFEIQSPPEQVVTFQLGRIQGSEKPVVEEIVRNSIPDIKLHHFKGVCNQYGLIYGKTAVGNGSIAKSNGQLPLFYPLTTEDQLPKRLSQVVHFVCKRLRLCWELRNRQLHTKEAEENPGIDFKQSPQHLFYLYLRFLLDYHQKANLPEIVVDQVSTDYDLAEEIDRLAVIGEKEHSTLTLHIDFLRLWFRESIRHDRKELNQTPNCIEPGLARILKLQPLPLPLQEKEPRDLNTTLFKKAASYSLIILCSIGLGVGATRWYLGQDEGFFVRQIASAQHLAALVKYSHKLAPYFPRIPLDEWEPPLDTTKLDFVFPLNARTSLEVRHQRLTVLGTKNPFFIVPDELLEKKLANEIVIKFDWLPLTLSVEHDSIKTFSHPRPVCLEFYKIQELNGKVVKIPTIRVITFRESLQEMSGRHMISWIGHLKTSITDLAFLDDLVLSGIYGVKCYYLSSEIKMSYSDFKKFIPGYQQNHELGILFMLALPGNTRNENASLNLNNKKEDISQLPWVEVPGFPKFSVGAEQEISRLIEL